MRRRPGLSVERQAQASWLMEVCLLGFVFVGLERGEPGIVVNSAVGLAVTQLVPLLERDYGVPMDPVLVLWITAAVFLHALGTVGIPGTGATFYRELGWWDHLTHALSSSVVAGVGYAFTRAVDEHVADVSFPPRFTFAVVLVVVLAFGVAWEVLEFGLGGLSSIVGGPRVLTQYGVGDTMMDLVFDTVGAVIVATWGTAHLAGLTDALGARIAGRPE